MPIFEIKNISYKYDKFDKAAKNAISNISFDIEKEDFIALIGKSGSGKSTLINHLNGLIKADSGDIKFNGQSIYDKNFNLLNLRFKCGLVFQYPEYQLFADTVLEDVAFGAIKMGFSKEEAEKKAIETLKLLDILNLKNEVPFNLSGGEKRKVAFCGVFVMDPDVIILDEPEAGLDSISKKYLFDFLTKINKEYHKTIMFITHNLNDALEYANKVILLESGKILGIGKPYEILSDEKMMEDASLELPDGIKIINEARKYNKVIPYEKSKFEDLLKELIK